MQPHRSYWLQEVLGDAPDAPPLEGDLRADVAILGGGYVGLWTAIRIKELEPTRDVAVVERDVCGGGASGRNGGFVLGWWTKLASLVALCGESDALRAARQAEAAIEEMRVFCETHGIDARFRRGGCLWTATSASQLGSWEPVLGVCERLGVEPFRRVTGGELARRAGSPVHIAGVLDPTAATIQPAALARGLRRVALEKGVRIYEHTAIRSFTRARPVVLRAGRGTLTAERLVIAANAWAAGIRELSRGIVAITSDMVMTAPVPERLREIGWTGGECITDSQMMVDYYQATRDGRIAFGKGGWGIALGGRIGPGFDRDARRARVVEADLRRTYPMLDDVPVTHDWSGPIDRTKNSLPLLGRFERAPHIVYGVGWSGNGVGPSGIGGRVLASLALERDDEWSAHPLVGRMAGRFPPEPIRFLGAHMVRGAVARKERAEMADRKPSRLDVALSRLVPAGIEDKPAAGDQRISRG
jgi:putative aminophosphonate oxidoreductase